MTPERWRRVEELYHAALAREERARAVFLAEACGGDQTLRRDVESLLAQPDSTRALTDGAVAAMAAQLVGERGETELTGRRIGAYHVQGRIGAGGMGEVYRARDTRLARDVAIKILPRALTTDPERLARFEREARMLAALNHPHIGAIYGFEEADGVHALILELVDGETLADRIARGPVAWKDALPIARQITEALEAAHERGIVHRDLKPRNIGLTRDGAAKVLDFGLAKTSTTEGWTNGSHAPTMTIAGTREGTVLGTASYMSPEQARGHAVDKRTDIWAFGCVLFEMLTGRVAFGGESLSDTIAAVLEREPDWSALPAATPGTVRRLLERCLVRDPKGRLRDIGDARLELDAAVSPTAVERSRRAGMTPRAIVAVSLGALAIFAAGAGLSRLLSPPQERAARLATRTSIVLPPGLRLESSSPLALSPDGTLLAYVATNDDGVRALYLRRLASNDTTELPGTRGAMHPFFSPDGLFIGFFADGAVQRVGVDGRAPIRVCPLPGVDHGGAWGLNDTIVVAVRGQPLQKVSASGGALEPLGAELAGAWPSFLPDGLTLLFTAFDSETGRTTRLSVVSLDGSGRRDIARLSDAAGDGAPVLGATAEVQQAVILPQGYLVFGQDPEFVRALPIDPESLAPRGTARTLGESVERAANSGGIAFAASLSGLLVLAETGDDHQLVWVGRSGNESPLSVEPAAYRHPRLSPDGRFIAVSANDETRRPHLWLVDAQRGTRIRLRNDAMMPAWTPDGQRVAHSGGGFHLTLTAPGSVESEPLATREQVRTRIPAGTAAYPTGWSPDGRFLLLQADNLDVWRLSFPDRAIEPVLTGPSADWGAVVSGDGRAIAYVSDESGRSEVYVARWPGLEQKTAVSTRGGQIPRWSSDSSELFYWQERTLMAARVGRSLRVEVPRPLFTGAFSGAGRDLSFDVAADGRFLMVKSDARAELNQVTVLQDWIASASVPDER
jgi:Tol biopolymer transport system component